MSDANTTTQQEVQTFREVPRRPEHCGVPMRRMSHAGGAGGLRTLWVCARECGHQFLEPLPNDGVKA